MKGELKMKDKIIGKRIGIFDVLHESDHRAKDGHKLYHIKCCECGWESDLRKIQIETTTKCTHLYISGNLRSFNTYTWENQRIRSIFSGMKSRCYDPDDKNYQWYGAKGIEICDEWLRNPKLFEKWALENGYDDFRGWLESLGLENRDIRDIMFLAQNGKLELEESAKNYLKHLS